MRQEPISDETARKDIADAAAICAKATELNKLIAAANDRGLHITFGVSRWSRNDGGPSYTTVSDSMVIERKRKWIDT
jgi:hypothetical protein